MQEMANIKTITITIDFDAIEHKKSGVMDAFGIQAHDSTQQLMTGFVKAASSLQEGATKTQVMACLLETCDEETAKFFLVLGVDNFLDSFSSYLSQVVISQN